MSHKESEEDLFSQYLDVCNQALQANKNRFPFKQILKVAQESQNQKTIAVHIIDDQPSIQYAIQLKDNKIDGNPHDCKHCQCDGKWRVTKSYLQNVINNPQRYIDNPAKINWEWIYDDRFDGH